MSSLSRVRSTIGCAVPLDLAHVESPAPVGALASVMSGLGYRKDTAAKAEAFAGAVSLMSEGKRFSLEGLEASLRVDHGVSSRQVRHLLDGGGFDPERLRLELIRDAAPHADAAVLERCECWTPEGRPYDITTVCLVGPDFAVPVGWMRVWGPTDRDGEEGPSWESVDHEGATAVLRDFRADFERAQMIPHLPPLISFDCTHGQSERLRTHICDLGFEFVLEVGPRYTGYEPDDPDADVCPRRLHEQIPFRAGEEAPSPRPHGQSGEFIVPYLGEDPSYAVAQPRLIMAPGELTGHRARKRAIELGHLAGSIIRPEAARRLRIRDFEHRNDVGLDVAATILSAYSATLEGRLASSGAW